MTSIEKMERETMLMQCATATVALAVTSACKDDILFTDIAKCTGIPASVVFANMSEIADVLEQTYGHMGGMEAGLVGLVTTKDGILYGFDLNICRYYVNFERKN